MIEPTQASLVHRLNTCVPFTCLVKSSKRSYFQRFQCLCHLVAINRRALLIPIYNLHFRPSLLALEGNMCLKNTLSKVAPYVCKSISTCVYREFFCKLVERKLLFRHTSKLSSCLFMLHVWLASSQLTLRVCVKPFFIYYNCQSRLGISVTRQPRTGCCLHANGCPPELRPSCHVLENTFNTWSATHMQVEG